MIFLCPFWILFTVGNVDRDIGRYSGRKSVDSWSTVGQQSVVSRSIVGRWSVDSEIDYRPSIGRYFDDAPRLTIGHVGDISVNCRWYISQLSVVYRSTVGGISANCRSNISVNLLGESNGFFFKQRRHLLLLSCDGVTCGSARRD